jgi:hypothetical protein
MPAFTLIWFGQLVSLLGTGMSRFALTIWAWELTGNATALAPFFGPLVGTGPGAGMGVLMLMTGVAGAIAGLGGYAIRIIRDAEEILPNHEAVQGTQA